jgi:hypothetical protein
MKGIMTNLLAVIILTCAMAATAAAQTPTSPPFKTTMGPNGELNVHTPDGGVVVVFPGRGAAGPDQIYRTSVSCPENQTLGTTKMCWHDDHTCANIQSDINNCCGAGNAAGAVATCNASVK